MEADRFLTEYCAQLNDQQKTAVQAVEGATLLLAVPGSGKTTVLINRLGYMVHVCGIPPASIFTMTYTNAATDEMKKRFADRFGSEYAKAMEFRTINGLSEQIINYYSRNHGRRDRFRLITDEGELNRLIREIYIGMTSEYPDESTVKDIKTRITYVKNMMLDDARIKAMDEETENFSEIYRQYCEALRQNEQMDYDDQMKYALQILKTVAPVREHYQERFRYFCVDESQDTSKIQHEIIRLLASRYNNIFMVGDEDQSIYGFRAAYPEALLRFEQDYPNAKVLLMEQNYRSTEEIVRAANCFVCRNRYRREKTIHATQGHGSQVQVITAANREAQYQYLFEIARSGEQKAAVLFRNNDSAVPLIDCFERSGIPYNCRKFDSTFFSHRVVSDLMDLIRLAESPADAEAFMRMYYKFDMMISKEAAQVACSKSQGSGRPVLEELLNLYKDKPHYRDQIGNLISVMKEVPTLNASDALRKLWDDTGYARYVEQRHLDKGKYVILSMVAKREKTVSDLSVRLQTLKELIQTHQNSSTGLITLSTIHSSKGLEYDRVFLLDVMDGILPSATLEADSDESEIKLYEEERRLFYVAMTRARKELHLFRCKTESAFVGEVMQYLPRPVLEDDDLFRPFQQNFCGKTYNENERGKGTVIAQCGASLLIGFPNGERILTDIGALYAEHRNVMAYREPEPDQWSAASKPGQQAKTCELAVGNIVTHKLIGQGRVIKLDAERITIRFFGSGFIREFIREASEKKGLIVVDSRE